MTDKFEHLKQLYYDPKFPGAFAGLNLLYKSLKEDDKYKYTIQEIRWWLSTQQVYTRYNKKLKRGKYRKVYAPFHNYMLDLDTAYIKDGKSPSKFFVLGTDIFSHLTHVVPINAINAKNAVKAFDQIIKHIGKPLISRSDKGVEYRNESFMSHLKQQGIRLFFSGPPFKSNYAERSIAIFKRIITQLMSVNKGKSWTDLLPEALYIMNHKIKSSINMSPHSAAKPENMQKVLSFSNMKHLKQQGEPRSHFYFQLGEKVRVRLTKGLMSKAHQPNFSEDVYEVVNRTRADNAEYFHLRNGDGEVIPDAFHYTELISVGEELNRFKIKKILDITRTRGGRIYKLIQWQNTPVRTFVRADEIHNYQ